VGLALLLPRGCPHWTVFDELRIAEAKTMPVDYGVMCQKLRTRIPYNVGLRN